MLGKNKLKEKMARGETVVLSLFPLNSPALAEMIALYGDGVIIEAEHTPMAEADVDHMIRAVETSGGTALVRVPSLDREDFIRLALESGAMGILAPHVRNADDARTLVSHCLFHPDGTRGAVPWSRSTGWGTLSRDENFRRTKEEVQIVPMIEDIEAVENIDEILAVPGISWVLIGRGDLSAQMHTNYSDPAFMEVCARLIDACKRAGVPFMVAGNGDEAAYWVRERGAAGVCSGLLGWVPKGWRAEVDLFKAAGQAAKAQQKS